jgi:hypothetical protein
MGCRNVTRYDNVRLLGCGPKAKGWSDATAGDASDFAQDGMCALSGGAVPATRPGGSTRRLLLMSACVGVDFR